MMFKNQYELRICEVSRGEWELNVYLKREGKEDRYERSIGNVSTDRLMLSVYDMLRCHSPRFRDGVQMRDEVLLGWCDMMW